MSFVKLVYLETFTGLARSLFSETVHIKSTLTFQDRCQDLVQGAEFVQYGKRFLWNTFERDEPILQVLK